MTTIMHSIRNCTKKIGRIDVRTADDARLSTVCKVLQLFGLLSFKPNWKLSVRAGVLIFTLVVIYIKDLLYCVSRIIEGSMKIPEDVEVLTFIQTQSITLYRVYLLIRHRASFRRLVGFVTAEFPAWAEGQTDELERRARRGTWIYRVHSCQLLAVGSLLCVRPLLSQGGHALIMQPPMATPPWMPVDRAPWYQMTYIFQVWHNSTAISIAFCMNMLFFTLAVRTCAHVECLTLQLLAACEETTSASSSLRDFVDRYNRIREFIHLLNQLFFVQTAVQPLYTGVSVITSLLVFDGTQQSFSFAGIALAHVLELFIYCYAGDLAAEMSVGMGSEVFGAPWYDMSPGDKKAVLQILQQCHRPFHIRAGFFGNFSREMFTTTMKTTYSVWAVLNQAK